MERSVSRDRRLPPIYAGFWRRSAAMAIDVLVLWPISFAVMLFAPRYGLVLSLAIGTLYPIYFHAVYGQTLGKMAVAIKVLRTDGRSIGWYEALWRSSVDLALAAIMLIETVIVLISMPEGQADASSWAVAQAQIAMEGTGFFRALHWLSSVWLYSELFTMLFNDKRRALHDFIGGTVVALEGTEALVARTQSWRGAPLGAGKVIKVGFKSVGAVAAMFIGLIVYLFGMMFFLTRTDVGMAIRERLGWSGSKVVDVAPGLRLNRPLGWTLTDDGADGHTLHAPGDPDVDVSFSNAFADCPRSNEGGTT